MGASSDPTTVDSPPMPRGADAVLPAEWVETDPATPCKISALAAVSPGKNLGKRGEDIVRGTILVEPGRVLRPQDLGVLSSVGHGEVRVIRRPRVRLAITGNELLPSGSHPAGFRIADANGPMLSALIERDGGVVDFPGLVRDDANAILEALQAERVGDGRVMRTRRARDGPARSLESDYRSMAVTGKSRTLVGVEIQTGLIDLHRHRGILSEAKSGFHGDGIPARRALGYRQHDSAAAGERWDRA